MNILIMNAGNVEDARFTLSRNCGRRSGVFQGL